MATHSSVLAWRIPEMGEPGGLPSMGSRRVGHDLSELAEQQHVFICYPLSGSCNQLTSKILGNELFINFNITV